MSKLLDVRGRITYISNHAKQENLYAVYETTDRYYWTELARFNQQEFQKSGTEGECIEAREFIIALPESFPNLYEPDKLLQLFTDLINTLVKNDKEKLHVFNENSLAVYLFQIYKHLVLLHHRQVHYLHIHN